MTYLAGIVQYIPPITRMEDVYGVTWQLVMNLKPDILIAAFVYKFRSL